MGARKIFFVHPLGVNWMPGERDMSRIANIMAPLGILSLCAWLEKHGHSTEVHDCYAFPGQDEKILERIRAWSPDFIGFSTTTSSFLDAVRLANRVKEAHPSGKIIFGGVHVSALREKTMAEAGCMDYGVVGEGEQALLELVEGDGTHPEKIEGLLYRDRGKAAFSGFRRSLIEMDSLPFPLYERLRGFPGSYRLPIFNYPAAPNTTVITSRGCPYQCSYCDRSVFGRTYRVHSPAYIMELLRFLHARFGIRHVNIYDDTFTLNRKRVMEFCEMKAASGLQMTFNCAARAEQIDSVLLSAMKRAGCWMISLGIETGDPGLLARHRSYAGKRDPQDALDMIRDKIHLIRKAGIRAKGLFMLGLPGETEATVARSMAYALSLPLDEFNLSKLTPFPGAPMYSDIAKHGTFTENWELMNALNFVFVPEGFTRERLEALHLEFYRRYFSRPGVLLRYLTMLQESPDSWKRFLRDLPSFLRISRRHDSKS